MLLQTPTWPSQPGSTLALAILGLCAACASGTSPDSHSSRAEQAPLADEVRFAGCAPLRYRAIEPGEVERTRHVARSPPPPVSFTVRPPFSPKPAHRAISTSITTQINAAKNTIVSCLEDDLDTAKVLQISVIANQVGLRLTTLSGLREAEQRTCVEKAIRDKLKARLTTAPQAILRFTVIIGAIRSGAANEEPERKRGTVEILSSTDRAAEALALSASVIEKKQDLLSCLATTKRRGAGAGLASLAVTAEAVEQAELELSVSAPSLADCWAEVLSGIGAPGVSEGGFQCAIGFGAKTAKIGNSVSISLERGGLVNKGGAPLAIDPLAKPPSSPIYKYLLALRFADARPSPAPAVLEVAGDVRGDVIVAVAEAARAADIEITMLILRGESDSTLGAALKVPAPRLGRFAARVARTTAIVGPDSVWLGFSSSLESTELDSRAAADGTSVAATLRAIIAVPGIAGRTDAIIGIEPDATGAQLAPVLAAMRAVGIDVVEVTSAENARARLAR